MTLWFPVEPMKAAIGGLPPDDGWAFEVKWDGYRTLAFIDAGQLKLQSTSGLDVTGRYPELQPFADTVSLDHVILDGELVVLDDDGRPRFELIQRHEREVVFQIFDVLRLGDHDTIDLPYEDRRRLLDQVVDTGSNWTVPSNRLDGGAELLAVTAAQGLEGVMAKRLGSTYQPGKRSPTWRKVKNRQRVEMVIGGFTPGSGNRASTFGALLLGRYDGDSLVFAGGVGTGFDQATLDSLHRRLRDLVTPDCPFDPPPPAAVRRTAIWVEPTLRASVEIAEFTNEGLARHASFIGLVTGGD